MFTTRLDINNINNIALFVRSAYGDLLMVDPLIKLIKQINSNAKITLFVEEKNSQLVPFMHDINYYYCIPSSGNKYLNFISIGLKYRKNKYDLCISSKTGTGTANGFFPFILGAKIRVSYVPKKYRWTDKLINFPVDFTQSIYNNNHYALGVLGLIVKSLPQSIPSDLYPTLKIPKKKRRYSSTIRIFLSVTNTRKSCQINNSLTSDILNKLSEKYTIKVYISTMEKDVDQAINLKNQLAMSSNIYITPTLEKFISLINLVDLCFIGEGGAMHIAAALDIRQVVLFGATSTRTWGPLSDKATVLSDKSNVNNISKNKITNALTNQIESIAPQQIKTTI